MNPTCRRKHLALVLMVVSALSLPAGWLALWKGSWPGTYGLIGIGLGAVAGLAAGWLLCRQLCQDQAALRYLTELAEAAGEDSFLQTEPEKSPPLPESHPFFPALQKLSEAMGRLRERAEQLDQLQTGFQVRIRRIQTEHQQIQTILEGIPEPVLALNEYGELLWANRPAEALWQVPPTEQARPDSPADRLPQTGRSPSNHAPAKDGGNPLGGSGVDGCPRKGPLLSGIDQSASSQPGTIGS
jgi:PAS domain-containing protein